MKSIWSYGNVFLMGVASTLLWVKWSGRWNQNHDLPQYSTVESLKDTNAKQEEVSINEMVEVLKTPEAVEKLKAGYIPKFKNGKVTDWEMKASLTQ